MVANLYGRDEEMRTTVRALEAPGAVVTLTGLPGAGTTSLARAAAERVVAAGPDTQPGLCLVEGRRSPTREGLTVALEAAAPDALVLVDDVDRVDEARVVLDELCRSRPDVRVLLTSRTPVGLPGEVVVRVLPLPLPDPRDEPGALRRHPTVRLFLDVAARTGTSVVLEDGVLGDIAQVCRQVGGLPLAIQLVAVRAATFSPATLVDLLDRVPSQLLRSPATPDHDLDTAVAWSISLLTPDQQELLGDLTIFRSLVPLDVIEDVCVGADVLDDLSALVDAHLVHPQHDGRTSRFVLPPLVREHLRRAGAWPPPAERLRRHTRWACRVAREAATLEESGHLSTARSLVTAAEPDLVDALTGALAAGDAPAASTLSLGLLPMWFNRGATPEHVATIDAVLRLHEVGTAHAPGTAAEWLLLAAWRELFRVELASTAEEVVVSTPVLERLREDARALGEHPLLKVSYVAVQAARAMSDRTAAEGWAREGVEIATRRGDLPRLVRFETWSGMMAHQRGDLAEAARWARSAVAHARQVDDQSLLLSPAGLLSSLPQEVRGPDDVPRPEQLVVLARDAGDLRSLDWLEPVAAFGALHAGDLGGAVRHSAATLRRSRVTGAEARAWPPMLCLFLVALARADLTWAGRLHGMLTRRLGVLRPSVPPAAVRAYDGAVVAYTARVPRSRSDVEVAWGAALSPDAAVEAALSYAAEAGRLLAAVASQPPAPQPAALPAARVIRMAQILQDRGGEEELTPRELEVLTLLSSGQTNREIAATLGISPKTVMHHTSRIYRKLAVRGRAEAVAWHLRSGQHGAAPPQRHHGMHVVDRESGAR
ncbi:LuxR C-terminal-related transcriptional regulator [Ornithinimicrobium cavernae]|uniref:LuxR C-terminal-related transcriptional regulator n=1 Tax=Ornithinimicrobium cavernae TaxID=2666047 RepID=UPI000D690655|nr:LuxR C-terminal-related transcriptional regulator [Ornithinimicrobium cavernae]